MKIFKKKTFLVGVLVLGIMLAAGCAALQKPAPQNPPGDQVPETAAPSQEPMPTDPAEVDKITSKLTETVAGIPGVNGSTVVLSGTTAYVGVDEKAGLEKGETDRIKRDVSNEVKKAEPRLAAVYVSSDPDMTTRLRKIADGVAAGQPVSSFDNELAEIAKRLSPTSR